MSEISKAVGDWILANVGWSIIIVLFLLSCFFKITKKNIDPLGWVVGFIGKALTKDVRKDISELKADTTKNFSDVKADRQKKIDELKQDYNKQISNLREDLDAFETSTNTNIREIKEGTNANCEIMKRRLNEIEKQNDMQTVRQIKAHVLDFANSCMNKRKHTKQDFDNIIAENAQYEKYVKKYKLENDVYKEDYAFIMKIYHQCQENNSFLRDSDA